MAEPEILPAEAVVPPTHDVTPGWVARHQRRIETARKLTRALMVVAPPPARIALGAASLAADAMLVVDEYTRRRGNPKKGAGDMAALTLEGLALMAASRFAPARLAASLGGIEAAREALRELRKP